MAIVISIGGMDSSRIGISSCRRPSTNEENTLGVEVKSLEIIVASHAVSTSSLTKCCGSLTPGKMLSLIWLVESLRWLSTSHRMCGMLSCVGLVVNTLILSWEMHSMSYMVESLISLMGWWLSSHGKWGISSYVGVREM